jgi:hypothetical protein
MYVCVYTCVCTYIMCAYTHNVHTYTHARFRINNFAAEIISIFGKWARCTGSSLPKLLCGVGKSKFDVQTWDWTPSFTSSCCPSVLQMLFRNSSWKCAAENFEKKKKKQFFFSFSSMKSISSHFGGKRNFFCSEIIYTKTHRNGVKCSDFILALDLGWTDAIIDIFNEK